MVIEKAIAAAKVVLVLWSRASVVSNWMRAEAAWALERNKVLSVKIENVTLPLAFSLLQTIDLTGWTGAVDDPALLRLLRAIPEFFRVEGTLNSLQSLSSAEATEALVPSTSSSPSGRGRGMIAPTGFWSYTTSDDKNSRGKLSQLRTLLAAELQQQ